MKYLPFFICLCLFSCKVQKRSLNDGNEANYTVQKKFNQHYYDGAKLKAIGDYEAAIKEFKLALKVNPKSHELLYQLANSYFKAKKLDEALPWAEQAVKKNKEYNFWYSGQLAQLYSLAKQYDKSSEVFASMVEKDPKRKSNYEEAGNQYLNAKKPKEAAMYFEKSISKFGPDEKICRKLEQLYFELGKPDDAIRIQKQLAETYPSEIKYLGLLAESYLKINKVNEAKAAYIKIFESDASNGFASFGMSDILRREGKNEESFVFLVKGFADRRVAIQHKLKVIASYYMVITKDEKSKAQAIELSKKLIETHPDDALAYQVYSDILFALNQFNESRDFLKQGLALDGKDYRIWQKLFGLDIKLANNVFLYDDSKAALELFTSHPGLFIIHSQAAMRIEQYDQAIEKALMGLDISFKSDEKIQLYLTLADAWFEKENFDQTEHYYKKALETDQQNPLVLNNYAYYLFQRNVRLSEAEGMILKALTIDPQNGSFADTYGCILMALGKLSEAELWIKKAIEKDGENEEVLEHLGDLLVLQGNNKLALQAYTKALKIKPDSKTNKVKAEKLINVK